MNPQPVLVLTADDMIVLAFVQVLVQLPLWQQLVTLGVMAGVGVLVGRYLLNRI